MMGLVYIILITLLGFGFIIMLRFRQLGMTANEAVIKTVHFPLQITYFHIKIFKMQKDEELKKRLKILFMPIFNLSEVLISYAHACIETAIEKEAILTLLSQTEEEQKEILIQKFLEKGYLVEEKGSSISTMDIKPQEYKVSVQKNSYQKNLNLKVS